jgi:hypothetical protein
MKVDTWGRQHGAGRAGFFVNLDDEHQLSVQWGTGIYADNKRANEPGPSATAEIYSPEIFADTGYEGSYPYVPVEKVFQLVAQLSQANSPEEWRRIAAEWVEALKTEKVEEETVEETEEPA